MFGTIPYFLCCFLSGLALDTHACIEKLSDAVLLLHCCYSPTQQQPVLLKPTGFIVPVVL
jgi:hypothetical protein